MLTFLNFVPLASHLKSFAFLLHPHLQRSNIIDDDFLKLDHYLDDEARVQLHGANPAIWSTRFDLGIYLNHQLLNTSPVRLHDGDIIAFPPRRHELKTAIRFRVEMEELTLSCGTDLELDMVRLMLEEMQEEQARGETGNSRDANLSDTAAPYKTAPPTFSYAALIASSDSSAHQAQGSSVEDIQPPSMTSTSTSVLVSHQAPSRPSTPPSPSTPSSSIDSVLPGVDITSTSTSVTSSTPVDSSSSPVPLKTSTSATPPSTLALLPFSPSPSASVPRSSSQESTTAGCTDPRPHDVVSISDIPTSAAVPPAPQRHSSGRGADERKERVACVAAISAQGSTDVPDTDFGTDLSTGTRGCHTVGDCRLGRPSLASCSPAKIDSLSVALHRIGREWIAARQALLAVPPPSWSTATDSSSSSPPAPTASAVSASTSSTTSSRTAGAPISPPASPVKLRTPSPLRSACIALQRVQAAIFALRSDVMITFGSGRDTSVSAETRGRSVPVSGAAPVAGSALPSDSFVPVLAGGPISSPDIAPPSRLAMRCGPTSPAIPSCRPIHPVSRYVSAPSCASTFIEPLFDSILFSSAWYHLHHLLPRFWSPLCSQPFVPPQLPLPPFL
ncbi:hypothetical protein CF326_g7754 [Tilletia indica]|nr:hypothetical protein CF326_g7754 [Tilletia indica]